MNETTIERVFRPSPALFIREYLAKNRPVILTGVVSEWPAVSRWTPQYFRTAFPGIKMTYEAYGDEDRVDDPLAYVGSHGAGLPKMAPTETTLGDFIELMRSSTPTRQCYAANWYIVESIPQLKADLGDLDPYMGWLSLLPRAARRKLQLAQGLWMGPAGSVSMLHFDRAHNLYAQIYGRKKFTMISPEHSRNCYFASPEVATTKLYYSPVNAEKPDLLKYPLFATAPRIEFVIEPGELLFIPTGWWHHVRTLEPALSLSSPWSQPVNHVMLLRDFYLALARRRMRRVGRGAIPQVPSTSLNG